jgi:hypothetical protein
MQYLFVYVVDGQVSKCTYERIGFVALHLRYSNFRVQAHTMLDHTVPMERSIVRTAYTSCSMRVPRCSRVFVLDYGGTILEKEKYGIYIKQTLNAITVRYHVR